MPRTTLTSAGSIRFLHDDACSLNFSNTTSFVRNSNGTVGSKSIPLRDQIATTTTQNQLFTPLVAGLEGTRTATFADPKACKSKSASSSLEQQPFSVVKNTEEVDFVCV